MNSTTNSTEIATQLLAPGRAYVAERAKAFTPYLRVHRIDDQALHVTEPSFTLRSTQVEVEEFWERLSYAIIWLCALLGVGICFAQ